ncbi:DJ-1/PfpI family protein [Anaerocolumna jejuensis]|uniref:DJ-1/PfpI family protein n=1 Tax=Anaerocolumna jejuensis TaxID=259063 RepID=UPI003F7C4ECD
MKVLLLLAKGFETMEFSVFIDIFGWAGNDFGCNITVETCGFTKQVISTFHVPVTVDKIIQEIRPEDYDALAIPGGFEEFGFYEEAYDEKFLKIIREFHEQKKPVASVCVAALALGKSGILKGRRATTYHLGGGRRQQQLKEFEAIVVNEPVVTDNTIITSYCPQTAPYVAFKLLELLTSKELTEAVKTAMGF